MDGYRLRANLSSAPNNFHLPPKPPLPSLIRRAAADAEISIFDAERYFNEADQDDVLKKKNVAPNGGAAESFLDGSAFRTRSFRASTPTAASSEASWNSQTGLLPPRPPGSAGGTVRGYSFNESRKGPSSSSSSSFRGARRFFGRHCPCSGKKSVAVEEKFSETRSSIRSHYSSGQGFPEPDVETMEMTKFRIRATEPAAEIGRRIVKSGVGSSFSFPVLISPAAAAPPPLAKELEEPARVSLEVFRPSVELARILTASSSAAARDDDDDVASDASSELFELESFSAHSSAAYRRRRDSLDELPKLAAVAAGAATGLEDPMAPGECYAPSEASVEWSVTTAEGGFERTAGAANFSSAASEGCGEVRSARAEKEVRFDPAATPARNDGGFVKKRGGDGCGLLNCGCEKAVSVGPDPVRFVPDQHGPL